ncbi:MAG: hypothetical protein ABII25_07930 [bacterium]
MKKNIAFALVALVALFVVFRHYSNIISLQKERIVETEAENKKVISEREDIKGKYSKLDKEKNVIYASTLVLGDKVSLLLRTQKNERAKFNSDRAYLSTQVSSLEQEKEGILKTMSDKEADFSLRLKELQEKLEKADMGRKELSSLLSKKNEELQDSLRDARDLKNKKSELENTVSELTDKIKELDGRITSLKKEKTDFMILAEGLKKDLLETDEELKAAEREIELFETSYDTTVLARFRKKLAKEFEKGFAKERENWDKEKRSLDDKLTKEKFNYYYVKAVNLFQKRMFEDAVLEFEKAGKLNPKSPKIDYNLAIIYDDHLKDKKRAVGHYKQYLKLNPKAADRDEVKEWIKDAKVSSKGM